jgi:hypothetical protein
VEFMRKEAADNALSLDGTSFMSRILKVMNIETILSCYKQWSFLFRCLYFFVACMSVS